MAPSWWAHLFDQWIAHTPDFIELFKTYLVAGWPPNIWSLTPSIVSNHPSMFQRVPNLHGRVKRKRWKLQGLSVWDLSKNVQTEGMIHGTRLIIWLFLSIVFGTKDKDWLDLLREAGLQVTIQVRLCSGPRAMLLARNTQSEAIKALGHPALSDSFVTFTKTVMGLGVDKVKDGEDLGLSFNGTSYNAAMH